MQLKKTMKKKHILLFLCLGLCLMVLTGCRLPFENSADALSAESLSHEPAPTLQDGTYTAVSEFLNPEGFGSLLRAEVHQGLITKVTFKEIDAQGSLRPDTQWEGCDHRLYELYPLLYSRLIENQSSEFDTVTGATVSSEAFKALSQTLLEAAASGQTETVSTDNYLQTYTALSPPDSEGYQGRLSVSYKDDTIVQVLYDEVNDTTTRSSNVNLKQTFNALTRITLTRQNLSPVSDSPASAEETSRYNALLQEISLQRVSFISY